MKCQTAWVPAEKMSAKKKEAVSEKFKESDIFGGADLFKFDSN